jgi:hypothetical protein
MNRCVEFHDSDVASVDQSSGVLRKSFDPAYIHASLGRPGIDNGEGYIQSAEIIFHGVVCDQIPDGCTGRLSDGTIWINGVPEMNGLPVPFDTEGDIAAEFVFCTSAVLRLTARSVSFTVHGPSRFVETFAA